MAHMFYTLQEFMLHAKGITYILMGLTLVGMVGFWLFLSGKDENKIL
ncbi:MAG: sulfate respiration complex protein HmcD [Desulfovibrionaceae bacterium]